jgi:hypothetical protein
LINYDDVAAAFAALRRIRRPACVGRWECTPLFNGMLGTIGQTGINPVCLDLWHAMRQSDGFRLVFFIKENESLLNYFCIKKT